MFEFILFVLMVYAAYRLCRFLYRRARASVQRYRIARQAAAEKHRQQKQREAERQQAAAKVNQAARLMQLALLQLRHSPDFRRAATFARQAQHVPVAFRRRQFRRLRPLLVEHLVTRLQGGTAVEQLLPGLTDLVTALGVAAYEADYIRIEGEGRLQQHIEARPGFAAQMRQLQSEHQRRLEAIRNLSDVAPELREQLLESEQQRFRERLLAAGDSGAGSEADQ